MTEPAKAKRPLSVGRLIFVFLMPTLVGKTLVYYCGLNYAMYPGEGYGWGLILSICFTLTMLGRFIWNFWDYTD